MDIFNLGEHILNLIEMALAFWNDKVGMVFDLLKQSPTTFKGGGPWAIVEQVEPIFVGVGSSLVVLFLVIGFCSESVDVREDMRFEVILRMLMRVGIAEWLVANNITIMKAFFLSAGNLVGLLTKNDATKITISREQADIIKDLGFGPSLIMLILSIVIALVIIICGFMLLYTVYFRFLKLLVVVPIGAIAFSTVSGNRTVSHTAVTYAKNFLSIVFEAVTIALAILMCNAFISAGLPSFTSEYADWTKVLIYLCELTFGTAMTVGMVKGAQNLTSKTLGL